VSVMRYAIENFNSKIVRAAQAVCAYMLAQMIIRR
jgi:hypothetical protein